MNKWKEKNTEKIASFLCFPLYLGLQFKLESSTIAFLWNVEYISDFSPSSPAGLSFNFLFPFSQVNLFTFLLDPIPFPPLWLLPKGFPIHFCVITFLLHQNIVQSLLKYNKAY